MSEDKVGRRSFFTPCRTVGLKRRSTGTPSPVQNSPKTSLMAKESEESSSTPKRVKGNLEKPICRFPKTLETSTKDDVEEMAVIEQLDCSVQTDTKPVESSPLDLEKQIREVESRLKKLNDDVQNLELVSLNAKQVFCVFFYL